MSKIEGQNQGFPDSRNNVENHIMWTSYCKEAFIRLMDKLDRVVEVQARNSAKIDELNHDINNGMSRRIDKVDTRTWWILGSVMGLLIAVIIEILTG